MDKKTLLWLGVVLIIAGFLRFYNITVTPPGLYPDEAVDGVHALHALNTGEFKVFYTENNGEEGLFAWVQALFIAASGGIHDPWILRLPSAVFGFFTVLGTFFAAREIFRRSRRRDLIGLLAAFFVATSFWHINFSRVGFRAIMAPLFMVWALYFFLKGVRAEKTGWSVAHAALGGIAFGLGFYSYISYRIMPLVLLIAIPFFRKEKGFLRATGVFLAATFIVALPLGLYFLHNPADFFGRTSQVSVFNEADPVGTLFDNAVKTIGMLDIQGDRNWRHNFSGRPELFWPVGIAFWIGVVIGIRALFGNERRGTKYKEETSEAKFAYLTFFSWIALAALPIIFSNEGIPHALRGILMIPPIMIVAAAGGAWLYDWLVWKLPSQASAIRALLLGLLLFVAAIEGYTYLVTWAQRPEVPEAFTADASNFGYRLKALPVEKPKYIVDIAGGGKIPVPDGWDPNGRIVDHSIFLQPAMFITDSYDPAGQRKWNIHYISSSEESTIPPDAYGFRTN